MQRHWSVSDRRGKIQVSLAQVVGSSKEGGSKTDVEASSPIAVFIFQPAPVAALDATGICWPSRHTAIVPATPMMTLTASHPASGRESHTPGNDGRRDSGIVVSPSAQDAQNLQSSRTTSSSSCTSCKCTTKGLVDTTTKTAQTVLSEIPGLATMRLPEDQMNNILAAIKAVSMSKIAAGQAKPEGKGMNTKVPGPTAIPTPPHQSKINHVPGSSAVRSNEHRTPTDVTMHMSCNAFPDCTVDDPVGGGLVHNPPTRDQALVKKPQEDGSDSGDSVEVVRTVRRDLVVDTCMGKAPEIKRQKRARTPEECTRSQAGDPAKRKEAKRRVSKTVSIKTDEDSFGVR